MPKLTLNHLAAKSRKENKLKYKALMDNHPELVANARKWFIRPEELAIPDSVPNKTLFVASGGKYKMPELKVASLHELVARSKETVQTKPAKIQLNNKPPKVTVHTKQSLRNVLHGTGLTKKVATQAEKGIERQNLELQKAQAELEQPHLEPERALTIVERARLINAKPIVAEDQPKFVRLVKDTLDGLEYDESQDKALLGITEETFSCLIGAAGTGKTTVIKQIVKKLEETVPIIDLRGAKIDNSMDAGEEPHISICFCAFTGRAVQQMKRPLPKEYHPLCNTIHATLGYAPEFYEEEDEETGIMKRKMRFVPSFGSWRKLPFHVYIIDEAGMVPIFLWNQLLDAMHDNARVIMVGDINQLPPVQGRSVLGFAMTKWPTFALEKIHRQALDNPIIANAHKVLNGRMPEGHKDYFDMIRVPSDGIETFNLLLRVIRLLHGKKEFDQLQDAVIVPQNVDLLGQEHINENLVPYFNPERLEHGVIMNKRMLIHTGITKQLLAVGDKIMLLENDRARGLTNGMTGVIVDITINGMYKEAKDVEIDVDNLMAELANTEVALEETLMIDDNVKGIEEKEDQSQRQGSHITTVLFENEEVKFQTAGDYRKMTHAYAFTCHKSQGGEYPTVIILCHGANWRMLSREWLYTAITRAQNRVVLLYNDRGIAQALNTQRVKGKNLAEKAARFIALQDKKDTSVPHLPEPMKRVK